MPQADQTVQNAGFPAVRADINDNLKALFSNSSGPAEPSATIAYMDWINTSGPNPVWKKRNANNSAWITVGTIVGNTIQLANTLPDQTGQSGRILGTNGTLASWIPIPPGSTVQAFTTPGTYIWVKPSAGSLVYVELWGGGGGGARGENCGGGGGGAFSWAMLPLAALDATAEVIVGAGGAGRSGSDGPGSNGGLSAFNFGSFIAGGGGGGSVWQSPNGIGAARGAGGGWRGNAANNVAGTGYFELGGGASAPASRTLWVGAAGGGADSAGSENGGSSTFGGGGGGGRDDNTIRTGGASDYGGAGGAGGGPAGTPGGNGNPRGGGGGAASGANGGTGGRGEVRVYVW